MTTILTGAILLVLGAGVEYKFAPRLTRKLNHLYFTYVKEKINDKPVRAEFELI